MTDLPSSILVTGGAGFIGSALVRHLIGETGCVVVNVDKLTYAGHLESLASARSHQRHHFEQVDICDREALRDVFQRHRPDAVVHLAAESHVDRSVEGAAPFIHTNLVGTFTLLEEARSFWGALDGASRERFRFLHVSTDEVYGSLGPEGAFSEDSPYDPRSPYSASKAGSDHLVRAWWHTYGLPVVMTNCSNNYGPYQFPEKLIPLTILSAIGGRQIPLYGDGGNVRDWLYVDDHVRALLRVLEAGEPGRTWNVGGAGECRNVDVARTICSILDDLKPRADGRSYAEQITFVADRPGHDRRYAIDGARIERELGWRAQETLESGLRRTVRWYLDNLAWCERVMTGRYGLERLGLSSEPEHQA